MPLFWLFSLVVFNYVLLFVLELYFFLMNEDSKLEMELSGEVVMDWWW